MYNHEKNEKQCSYLKLSKDLADTSIESIGRQWDTTIMKGGYKCVHTRSFTNYSGVEQMKT